MRSLERSSAEVLLARQVHREEVASNLAARNVRTTKACLAGLVAAISIMNCSGCTNHEIYDSTTDLRTEECEKVPASEVSECLDKERIPYDEYKRARDEAIGKAGEGESR